MDGGRQRRCRSRTTQAFLCVFLYCFHSGAGRTVEDNQNLPICIRWTMRRITNYGESDDKKFTANIHVIHHRKRMWAGQSNSVSAHVSAHKAAGIIFWYSCNSKYRAACFVVVVACVCFVPLICVRSIVARYLPETVNLSHSLLKSERLFFLVSFCSLLWYCRFLFFLIAAASQQIHVTTKICRFCISWIQHTFSLPITNILIAGLESRGVEIKCWQRNRWYLISKYPKAA